jgi:hypothetical protein
VHVENSTNQPYEDVVMGLKSATGDVQDVVFARELSAAADTENFERRMHACLHEGQRLMGFLTSDYEACMAFAGYKARCQRTSARASINSLSKGFVCSGHRQCRRLSSNTWPA